jgi:hypothetical protein
MPENTAKVADSGSAWGPGRSGAEPGPALTAAPRAAPGLTVVTARSSVCFHGARYVRAKGRCPGRSVQRCLGPRTGTEEQTKEKRNNDQVSCRGESPQTPPSRACDAGCRRRRHHCSCRVRLDRLCRLVPSADSRADARPGHGTCAQSRADARPDHCTCAQSRADARPDHCTCAQRQPHPAGQRR